MLTAMMETLCIMTLTSLTIIWAASWQNQQCGCAPSEYSDEPGHPPSLIRVFVLHSMGSKGPQFSSRGQRRLIRLGGCPGWSESSLGAHAILLGLSWDGSYLTQYYSVYIHMYKIYWRSLKTVFTKQYTLVSTKHLASLHICLFNIPLNYCCFQIKAEKWTIVTNVITLLERAIKSAVTSFCVQDVINI